MTVTTSINREEKLGDGVTTVWPYSLGYTAPTDILVYVNGVQLTYGTQYTVTTTQVTTTAAAAVSAVVIIQRKVPATQAVDYQTLDPFPANTHEGALDKLTYLCQQNQDAYSRAIIFPEGESLSSSAVLTLKATRALTVLGFDGVGNLAYYSPLAVANAIPITGGAFTGPVTSTSTLQANVSITAGAAKVVLDGATGNVTATGAGTFTGNFSAANITSINQVAASTLVTTGAATLNSLTVTNASTLSGAVTLGAGFGGTQTQKDTGAETLSLNPYNIKENLFENGDFSVSTRFATQALAATGKSNPANNTYYLDRVYNLQSGTAATWTVSRQAHTLGQTSVPGNPRYFGQWLVTTAAGTTNGFGRRVEDVVKLSGKVLTLAFWARVTAGSATVGSSIDQKFGTTGSPSANVNVATQNYALTTTWTRFTKTITVPSISGKTLGTDPNSSYVDFSWTFPLTNGVTYQFSDMMLVEGSTAPAYYPRETASVASARCFRYAQPWVVHVQAGPSAASGWASAIKLSPPMRSTVMVNRITSGDNNWITTGTAVNVNTFIPNIGVTMTGVLANADGEAVGFIQQAISTAAGDMQIVNYLGIADAELY